jgi:putative ABC transport system substrate-binding protein
MIRRRDFITLLGGAAAWPRVVSAQQGDRVRRIGVLMLGEADDQASVLRVMRDELQKLGWVEGGNLRIDVRFLGAGDVGRARAGAGDLVGIAPDVIVAAGGAALDAAQQETKTIPIVFVGAGDPAETGRVKNTAHPEGNATGFANAFGPLGGKQLELLKEAAPNVTRVLYLPGRASLTFLPSIEAAAAALAVQLVTFRVSDAVGVRGAIESFAAEPNGGLIPSPGILSLAMQRELIRWAEQYRLPMIASSRTFAVNGALMSYASDGFEIVRGVASYVDRILRGAKVSDCRSNIPRNFSWSSTSRPPRRSASTCHNRSCFAPTR